MIDEQSNDDHLEDEEEVLVADILDNLDIESKIQVMKEEIRSDLSHIVIDEDDLSGDALCMYRSIANYLLLQKLKEYLR